MEEDCENGILSVRDKDAVIGMTEKVSEALTRKYRTVKKGVKTIMGGEILEYPSKTLYKQGIAQGREEGLRHAAEVISQKYNIPADELRALLNSTSDDARRS